ncbi:MAG: AI-2E family transporter [Candidatus Woesearchaeota archaeon]
MYENKLLQILLTILLSLLVIYLATQINFLIDPVISVIFILIPPILFGGFFYYMLRPIVRFLTGYVKIKSLSVIISFILISFIIFSVVYFGGSIIENEVNNLIQTFNNYYEITRQNQEVMDFEQNIISYLKKYNIWERLARYTEKLTNIIKNNFVNLFSTLTNISTILLLTIINVFYFLKDEEKIYKGIVGLFPEEKKTLVKKIARDIDEVLSMYIGGQIIVALILGILILIGYLIIGLPNVFILSLFATILNFIPFIGPILGVIPAILIALTTSLIMVLKVLIVMVIVQQLEGNVIQPMIQGKRLNIHNLIIIFMVTIFIIVFGFLGSLFAVPFYASMRELVRNLKQK